MSDPQQRLGADPLTPRELEVLRLIAEGLSNQGIANQLYITVGTVKGYVKLIFGKLGVASRTQAIAAAREAGLLEPVQRKEQHAFIKSTLPQPATPFVGRVREVAEVRSLLLDPAVRLITLVGPGGIGKTRLAMQVAAGLADGFADGVCFVPLASVNHPAFIASALIDALGLPFDRLDDLRRQVVVALRDRRALLVLDNLEHLLGGLDLLTDVIEQCPSVKILATSRERLSLQEEWTFPVPGLICRDWHDENDLEDNDAVELFIKQALRNRPGFRAMTVADRQAVLRICHLVEGMPLGIELAATWLRALSVEQIAEHITRDLDFLATRLRNVPERHRSIRALFEHSWRLLTDAERDVLMRMAVFAGGFDLRAVQEVVGATVGQIVGLIDKSLVQPEIGGCYDMHELLRQFVRGKLKESGCAEDAQNAHLAYFLALAKRLRPMLEQPDPQAVLYQLDREHDNIRAALQWSLDNGDTASGLQLASLMGLFWFMRGHLSEGRAHLRRALSTPTPTQTSLLAMRASALDMSAILARYQGDYAEATALTRESLAICQSLGDRQGIANAQANLGFVLLHQGNIDAARDFYQHSLALGRALGNRQGIADAVSHLALAELYAGQVDSARAFGEECLAIWRQLGDQEGVAWALHILGNIRLALGDPSGALLDFSASLSISEGMYFRWGMVWSLEDFARLANHHGEHGIALRLVRAGAIMRRSMGLPLPTHEHAELDRLMVSASQVLGDSVAGAAGGGAAEQLTWPECTEQILLLKERITVDDAGVGPSNA